MKTEEEYITEGWKRLPCMSCDGHGLVADYGYGEDFYGEMECNTCRGTGTLWTKIKERRTYIKLYPAGPFA